MFNQQLFTLGATGSLQASKTGAFSTQAPVAKISKPSMSVLNMNASKASNIAQGQAMQNFMSMTGTIPQNNKASVANAYTQKYAFASKVGSTAQITAPKTVTFGNTSQALGNIQNMFSFSTQSNVKRTGGLSMMADSKDTSAPLSQDELKKLVGYKSVDDYVKSGMVVGLGTGSTAYFAVERVGQLIASGELKDVICIPTSVRTKEQAESLNIPLCTLNEKSKLDVAIDGADDVDTNLALVKGGGGALLREKMVEVMADKFICIVDESKLCKGLGPGFPLPVEITPFCHEHTVRVLENLPSIKGSCKAVLRMGSSSTNQTDGDEIAVSDNGNYLVDLHFNEPIKDVNATAKELKSTVGVVEHGIFEGMTQTVIVAGKDGIRVAGEGGEKPWW